MLRLKFHLMRKADSLEKMVMLGKIEGKRRREWQRMKWLDGITDSMDEFEQTPEDSEGQRSMASCSAWGLRVGHALRVEQGQFHLSSHFGTPGLVVGSVTTRWSCCLKLVSWKLLTGLL